MTFLQQQKGWGTWERCLGYLHWSWWHSNGVSATWQCCGAADQAPDPGQGKVGIAQAGVGSGGVGTGVVPVIAQWHLGDLHQPGERAHRWFCKERRHIWIFFQMGEERTIRRLSKCSTVTLLLACGASSIQLVSYPECTDSPEIIPGLPESSPTPSGNFNTDLSRARRFVVQKSTPVRSRPISSSVLSTIVAISRC